LDLEYQCVVQEPVTSGDSHRPLITEPLLPVHQLSTAACYRGLPINFWCS